MKEYRKIFTLASSEPPTTTSTTTTPEVCPALFEKLANLKFKKRQIEKVLKINKEPYSVDNKNYNIESLKHMIEEIKTNIEKTKKQIIDNCPSPKCDAAKKAVSDKKEENKKNKEELKDTQGKIVKLELKVKANFKKTGDVVKQTACQNKCENNKQACLDKCSQNKKCKASCEANKKPCITTCIERNVLANFNLIDNAVKEIDPINKNIAKLQFDLDVLNDLQAENPTNARKIEIENVKIEIGKKNEIYEKKLTGLGDLCNKGIKINSAGYSPFKNPAISFNDIKDILAKKRLAEKQQLIVNKGAEDLKNLEAEKKKICGN